MVKSSAASMLASDVDVRGTDVFISYDSEDLAFVEKLKEAIRSQKLQIWEIGKNLPIGVSPNAPEAWQYVATGIRSSSIFVFVISPESVASAKNQNELTLALQSGKHLVPICCREVSDDTLPKDLHNRSAWFTVDLLSPEPFKLVAQRINQFHIYVRLQERAEEWIAKGQPQNLLLGKKDLESINHWVKQAVNEQLPLTKVQQDYLKHSRQIEGQVQLPAVLISYSRKNKPFVEKLCAALRDNDISYWVDWENIPVAAPWREELAEGIRNASNFLFVMSRDSVASKYCYDEINQAASHNKRIISFVLDRDYDRDQVHPAAKERNWLYLDEFSGFEDALSKLLEAIKKDEPYVKKHTDLQLDAIEWDSNKRHDEFLLNRTQLKAAQQWLQLSDTKEPKPTELQKAFINASANKQRQNCISRIITIGGVSALAIGGLLFALTKTNGEINALVSALDEKKGLDALMTSLKADKEFDQNVFGWWLKQFNPQAQARVVAALHKSIYNLNEYNRLEGHQGRVYTAIYSHNGKLIASADQNGIVKLWSADGKLINTFTGHTADVTSLDFSGDDQVLASASDDGSVKLWKVAQEYSLTESPLIKTLTGHQGRVYKVRFSPDGKSLASASTDKTIKRWSKDGKLLETLSHGGAVYNLSFSPDGRSLASASVDGARLWTQKDGLFAKVPPIQLSTQPTVGVSFSPDGQRIAATSFGNNVQLWDRNGKPIAILKGHQDRVRRVTFSHDNKLLASASDDNTVRLWTTEGKPVMLGTNQPLVLRGHQDAVTRVEFSRDDQTLISAGVDGTIKIWRISDGTLLDSFEGHRNDVSDIDLSPDSKIVISAGADGTVRLWKLGNSSITTLHHQNQVFDVSYSPTSELVATAGYQTIRFWKPDGTLLGSFPEAHQTEVRSISISPDGRLLASAGEDGQVRLWSFSQHGKLENATSKDLIKQKPGLVYAESSVSFSPDGNLIAAGGDDQMVRLWDQDGSPVHSPLAGHHASITSVGFGPAKSQLLISSGKKASKDAPGEVILWNIDGKLIKRLTTYGQQPLGDILSVSISPDGRFIAAADSSDNTIKLWKLIENSFDHSFTIEPFKSLPGHMAPIRKVIYSKDGKLLASASDDGTIKLWTAEGTPITTLRRHQRSVTSISFSPNAQTLASSSQDRSAILWQLPNKFDKTALTYLTQKGCNNLGNYLATNNNPDPQIKADRQEIGQFCNRTEGATKEIKGSP
jgi:WD40 repeat protein